MCVECADIAMTVYRLQCVLTYTTNSFTVVLDSYPAEWAGVVDDKPMVGGLEKFALRAMEMLKTAITNTYPLEVIQLSPSC